MTEWSKSLSVTFPSRRTFRKKYHRKTDDSSPLTQTIPFLINCKPKPKNNAEFSFNWLYWKIEILLNRDPDLRKSFAVLFGKEDRKHAMTQYKPQHLDKAYKRSSKLLPKSRRFALILITRLQINITNRFEHDYGFWTWMIKSVMLIMFNQGWS